MHEAHSQSAAHLNSGRLLSVLILTAAFMVIEVAGGLLTGSLALIADAGHMLTDVAGITIALLAVRLASRPATAAKSYGFYRLEILAAMVNGMLLLGVGAFILFEAYRRLSSPPDVLAGPMLLVAIAGLAVNLVSARLLMAGQKVSLNLHAAFLEVVSDFLGSVAVLVAGLLILLTGFKLIDLIASVAIGLFVVPRTWQMMNDAMHVLLEGVPRHINVEHVRDHILSTEGVTGVHDLHVWSLTSGMDVISAHVVVGEDASAPMVLEGLCQCLQEHFDIEHSTFQIESSDRSTAEHAAHMG